MSRPLNPRYTFPEFIVGRSNEAAYTAASAAAVAPGRLYNPILITGATGLGKTHLAHAVTAESVIRPGRTGGRAGPFIRPGRPGGLVTADDFLRLLARGVAAGDPAAGLMAMRDADLLV